MYLDFLAATCLIGGVALPIAFLDTFQHYPVGAQDTSSKWTSGSVASFAGGVALSPANLTRSIPAGQSAACGVRLLLPVDGGMDRTIIALLEAGTPVVQLVRVGASGKLRLITSAATTTSAIGINAGSDYHLELAVRLQGAGSTFEVRRQGVVVADLTGTAAITAASINAIRLNAANCEYGYVWARSGAGAIVAGDFMGPLATLAMQMASAGFYVGANWSGSVGDIGEQHLDLDATFRRCAATPTGAAADRFSHRSGQSTLPRPTVYKAAQVCVAAMRQNASVGTYRITVNDASTTSNGPSIIAPVGTYGYGLRAYDTDPITASSLEVASLFERNEYGVEALTLA